MSSYNDPAMNPSSDNSENQLQSALPNMLQTNANDENQSIRVESVILEADQHNWVANNFGKSTFVLPKKASVLSNDGLLIWRTIWRQYDIGEDKSATFPRESGGVIMIKRARLYVDGKILSSNEEVGKYLHMKNKFLPYDAQAEILDEMVGSNHKYAYDANGLINLSEDKRMAESGSRDLTDSESATYECAVPLAQLFKMLGDTLLPMSIRGEIRIEIEWEGRLTQVISEGGTWAGADKVGAEVVRPRLHLDYIQYAPEIEEALKQQIMSPEGMTIPFREPILIQKQLPALTAGANNARTDDLELGFMDRSVMKMYVQKLSTDHNPSDNLTRECRSDGLTGEEVQLIVNNKTMFDRPIERVSEMYSHLNQTGETPFNTLPQTYGSVGVYNTADANAFLDTIKLPSNIARPTVQTGLAGVRNSYQGRQRWLGFNFAQQRSGADTPSNSMKIGEAPIILRITRKNTGNADETANDARTQSAVNVNIWVECVNALVMKNGRVELIEL